MSDAVWPRYGGANAGLAGGYLVSSYLIQSVEALEQSQAVERQREGDAFQEGSGFILSFFMAL